MQVETFGSVHEWWKIYGTGDGIVNINRSVDEPKSAALNGCWKKLWPDLWGFPNWQDKIRKIRVLAHEVPGKGFPDLEEPNNQEVLYSHAADLTEEDL
jgi:hypothetical protein